MEGTPFGRYRLLELLGRGGMGEVWRAFDTDKKRVVAVKVLSAHVANDPVFEQRFRREAFAAASLNEPHVVPIHNFGEIDGRLYVDMRLIEGRDLQTLLSDGPLAPGRSVWIVEQVASALHAAHRVGLVHRDVKPSNILILKDDFAYLIDFGIAQAVGEESLTSTGNTVGTWAYMAPERLSGKQIDARADVYALACVLYECLTGSQPFPGDRFEQQIGAHLSMPPPRPSMMRNGVPSSLDPVIAKGMAKEPDERYPTTKDLARAARSALTAPMSPVPPAYPVPLPTEPVATQETVRLPLPPTAHIAEPQTVRMPLPPTQPVRYVERGPVPPVHPPTTRDELSMAATAYGPISGPQPALQPPTQAATPPPVSPEPPRKKSRALMIAVISAVVLAVVATTVVVLSLGGKSGGSNNASGTSGRRPGPINGTFSADLGAETDSAGNARDNRPGVKETWAIQSVCGSDGCVATAKRKSGETTQAPSMVLDEVNGRWIGVTVTQGRCNSQTLDKWEVMSFELQPGGTLSGDYSYFYPMRCSGKRTVTFTRTGDVTGTDEVADPSGEAARVASPAEALYGSYQLTQTFPTSKTTDNVRVHTYCLRSGDRCVSYFYGDNLWPMTFANDSWTANFTFDGKCPSGGTSHVTITAEFPLPQTHPNPIATLTGNGRQDSVGTACSGSDFDAEFVRTGD